MGTIAARDALRVLELSEQVSAAHVIACVQALRLRQREGEIVAADVPAMLADFVSAMNERVPFLVEDQPLDGLLRLLCAEQAGQVWDVLWEDGL